MAIKISLTNESFDFLGGSSEFLNLILKDLSCCILLLDKDMMLYAFNDPLKNIFSNKPNEDLLYKKCGNVIGCAFAVEEEKECGNTSQCAFCSLRETAIKTYTDGKNVFKGQIDREFYKTNTLKTLKHLQFSTRLFNFRNDTYIILIIEDITTLVNMQATIKKQQIVLDAMQ